MKKHIFSDQKSVKRCWWCQGSPLYQKYHDKEWGVPIKNDRKLFEKICLEGFQAGLSWITILKKREDFREAFDGFEIERVARFTSRRVEKLLTNESIIRHRGKIEATINNAQRAIELQDQAGSLARFFWSFEPKRSRKFDAARAITDESTDMSKQLRKLGWKFVGPTTCYSFMQAMGFVNDHHPDCHRHAEIKRLRAKFARPKK